MLVLSTLRSILSQALSFPTLHTAVLLTPSGELISAAYDSSRPKDEVRIVVGLSCELWHETQGDGFGIGMMDSVLGRIVVVPVDDLAIEEPQQGEGRSTAQDHQPLMLLALNSTDAVEWEELQSKGIALASHFTKPLSKFRAYLEVQKSATAASNTISPLPLSRTSGRENA